MKSLRPYFILAALWLPAANAATLPGPVVTDAWLAEHLAEVRVLDVGNTPATFAAAPGFAAPTLPRAAPALERAAGHVPGAVLVDPRTLRVERVIDGRKVQAMLPPPEAFTALVRQWGVGKGQPVVVVPLGASTADIDDAARLYWQLKVYGHDAVALLDGGLNAWLVAGRPWSSDAVTSPPPGDWEAGPLREELLAGMAEVEQALAAGKLQFVDGRDLAQFHGLAKRPIVTRGGHLPGARALPPELVTRQLDGAARFLDAASYRTLLAAQGIAPDAPTITYCNTGHLAAGAWFVMHEIVGNKQVELYDGSMHEWTQAGHAVDSAVP